ncbi:DUF7261 family protein [Natranaeroarchaeum aerophilus]|uniref:Uncharacterized protein n=1 Tax=Natranaeroarchaeum aerophilus TaxID=2917711 RepID=A0AAE3FRB7_9EURY|nr:hypothetical protein [Natranaeroarchaeum aerophilus]MCL9814172.1 hypothetical protein [Natranaeroarchaeum aerophilus]
MTDLTPDARGQLVLLAAAVIAFALATGALAYLQVGSHPDIDPRSEEGSPERIVGALDRSVHDATASVPEQYDWDERESAVGELEDDLEPRVETLRVSELERSVVHEIAYDETDAATWAADDCPSGPDRQFGDCEAIGGIVVQERAGGTHVLGVSFEIRSTSERVTHETSVRATGQQ